MEFSTTILVVDDQPDNFDVIESLLANQNYQLHYVSSGHQALESLNKVNPDLILLDVMMPDMDGIQLCQKIKSLAEWQAVPIIMVTALTKKADLERCLDAGADDFISKPVHGLELRARVRSMLRIRQQYNHLQDHARLKEDTARVLSHSLRALRGNLATTLSHELKTPLTGILGGLDFLRGNLQALTLEEMDDLIEISYESACRLEALIQKLLNYSTLEVATIQPDVSAAADARTIPTLVCAKAKQYNRLADLHCLVPAAALLIAPEHLRWAINELVDNAFKFSSVNTPVTVEGDIEGAWFHLRICDRGCGFTADQIAQIGAFVQFERNRIEQQGTGLGLAIAKRAVDLWGGQVELASTPAGGTTITLSLRLKPSLNS